MNTPVYSGVITNYVCTAACRHCMFASSPDCPKEYITAPMAEHIAEVLEMAGTESVHIGGGEPFMHFGALCGLIEALHRHGVEIDYIETNAFWCSEDTFARKRLETLRDLGVTTVMVSVDPFHIEYVPLERPLRLCRLLREEGFDYFVWQERYLRKLMGLDRSRTYSRQELAQILGENYIADTAAEYGLGMNGRALRIADSIYEKKPAEMLLTDTPCGKLLQPQHCHFDLYGNAVPSGCPGIAVEMEDYLRGSVPEGKYPAASRLARGGTAALFAYAAEQGFVPDSAGYPTRCALCYAMRAYLAGIGSDKKPTADLAPACFYRSMEADQKL